MSLNFETLYETINQTKRCSISDIQSVSSNLLEQTDFFDMDNEITESPFYKLHILINTISNQNITVVGVSESYHNLAVTFAKSGFQDYSCTILERGLKSFPNSVDLLADYIKYGIECNRIDTCKSCYNKLQNISKNNWTWRSFVFSIDYILNTVYINCNQNAYEEAITLANNYKLFYPNSEQPYFTLSNIYDTFNKKNLSRETLEKALEQFSIAPKCSLKLADISFENGDYTSAITYAKRAISNSISTQPSINISYCYLIIALCHISIALDNEINSDTDSLEKIISTAYHNAHVAIELNSLDKSLFLNLKQVVKMAETHFNLENPFSFDYD
ncbi:MAG: hypothetical protein IJA36_02185 [Lachnospiraceae bacterium]|nr:hypothetical protein [Lachnospiraceae bacterium]